MRAACKKPRSYFEQMKAKQRVKLKRMKTVSNQSSQKKPRIAVPIGDPAGVGPEIAAKACALEKVQAAADGRK